MASKIEEKVKNLNLAIYKMSINSVEALIPAFMAIIGKKRRDAETIFLTRGMNLLNTIADQVTAAEIAAAESDVDLLLTLLQKPEVQKVLPTQDPLAEAKIRGIQAQKQLLALEGGCVSSEQAAELLGIKRQAVEKRRKHGKLIGLQMGRIYQYPLLQFQNGKTLPGLEETLHQLSVNVKDPWMQLAWILNENARLLGQSPIQLLQAGHVKPVLEAASLFGEQTAS